MIPARAAANGEQDAARLRLRGGASSGDGAGAWRRASTSSSSTRPTEPDQAFIIDAGRTRYLGNNYNIKADAADAVLLAAVPRPGELLPALFVAGRVRGPRDQGNRLDRLLGRDSAITPMTNMGQQLYEPPDVNGWELGPGVDLDLVDAGAHELRVDARCEPALQPRARRAAVPPNA